MRPNPAPAPAPVRAAAIVQYATVALALLGAVLSVLTTTRLLDALPDALTAGGYTPAERDKITTGAAVASYGLVALWLVFALVFAAFARWYTRGARWARTATFAVAGLLVLCGACGLTGGRTVDTGTAQGHAVDRALDAAVPGWWGSANAVVQALGFAAYAAIIVLLALPASRPFFRRPAAPAKTAPPSPPAPGEEVSE